MLITEVEKRPARYSKATPEYSDKNCKELWTGVCEAVVLNWSRLDTRETVATGKDYKPYSCSLRCICRNIDSLYKLLQNQITQNTRYLVASMRSKLCGYNTV
jgi:hypothetical protein